MMISELLPQTAASLLRASKTDPRADSVESSMLREGAPLADATSVLRLSRTPLFARAFSMRLWGFEALRRISLRGISHPQSDPSELPGSRSHFSTRQSASPSLFPRNEADPRNEAKLARTPPVQASEKDFVFIISLRNRAAGPLGQNRFDRIFFR